MNARTRFHPPSFILHPSPGARGKPRRYATALRHSSFIIHHSSFPRNAFTLVEMLVVIVILTMLAGMVMFAIRGAQESARESKTKATILKLHEIVAELYGSYETRRVPINTSGMAPLAAAQARLYALRDIMRMEMPERKSDLIDPATGNPRGPLVFPWGSVPHPTLHQAYLARLSAAPAPMDRNAPAECLYLIVTLAGGEDARAQFTPDEVADTDGNGLPEFIDGWGRPIFFLRWAPGFNDSDLQPKIRADPIADRRSSINMAVRFDHDPFDTRNVDFALTDDPDPAYQGWGGKRAEGAWRLVPLIYSAGPDGHYGVGTENDDGTTYIWSNDTYTRPVLMGTPAPTATGAVDTHFDNIHNHRVETP